MRFIRGHQCRSHPQEYIECPETGCWLWQRAIKPEGYGYLTYKGKTTYAHRLYYERKYGPIPDGMEIDHLCRNRACVNPNHLEAVSRAQNTQRGIVAKLTEEDVRTIREEAQPRTYARYEEIAREYGVSSEQIRTIVYRKNWTNV